MDNQNRLKINVETPSDPAPAVTPPRPQPVTSRPPVRPQSYGRPVSGSTSFATRRSNAMGSRSVPVSTHPSGFTDPRPPIPSQDDLNSAFGKKPTTPAAQDSKKSKKAKKPFTKARKISIAAFAVGMLVLIGGIGFCAWRYLKGAPVADARFLVEVGSWQMQDEEPVIWKFTDIGHGTLTTNKHINDYDFIWALDGNEFKIDTNWLYTLSDAFTYELDQSARELKITSGDQTYTFIPAQG